MVGIKKLTRFIAEAVPSVILVRLVRKRGLCGTMKNQFSSLFQECGVFQTSFLLYLSKNAQLAAQYTLLPSTQVLGFLCIGDFSGYVIYQLKSWRF